MLYLSSALGVSGSQGWHKYLGFGLAVRRRSGAQRRTIRGLSIERLEGRALLATITVSSTHDAGAGSLRAAIEQANLDAAQDTITFALSVTGTISLASALPDLSAGMNIIGPGPLALTVTRSNAAGTPEFRLFTVDSGAQVTISGLTISGNANNTSLLIAGGIDNSGTLMLMDSTLTGNSDASFAIKGYGGYGGGIDNSGTMMVSNTTISGNTAGAAGGGIENSGTLTLIKSTVSGNSALRDGLSSGGYGGGIDNSGKLTVVDCTISGNSVGGGSGGGISNGLGFTGISGTATINASTISGNSASYGGGIYNVAKLTVTNSTISDNSAGPGVTIPAEGRGGGIANFGTLSLTYATISDNSAYTSGAGIAEFANSPGAKRSVVVTIDSIFQNTSGGNISVDPGSSFRSRGHNLFSNRPRVRLLHSDLINSNPLLGPLASNGGPTMTMALLTGSPAIDAGVAVPGVTTDQRGVARPQGSASDIGAFESPNVQRFGIHDQPTTLVLNFGEPLDAARAENLANYILIRIGPGHRPGTTDDTVIPILSASYDIASQTVTLKPTERLPINWTCRLTVVCTPPVGLTDTSGDYLDGAGMGQPGSDFVAIVSRKSLAGRVGT